MLPSFEKERPRVPRAYFNFSKLNTVQVNAEIKFSRSGRAGERGGSCTLSFYDCNGGKYLKYEMETWGPPRGVARNCMIGQVKVFGEIRVGIFVFKSKSLRLP